MDAEVKYSQGVIREDLQRVLALRPGDLDIGLGQMMIL